MFWYNIFHIYQPPGWNPKIINKVAKESYYPFFKELKNNKRISITLNITGSLTEQLKRLGHSKILNLIKELTKKNQIELITTGAWHPIFPLIPAELIRAQLTANLEINRTLYKILPPTGCWLPELAYHAKLDDLLLKQGIKWIVLDEIAARAKHAPQTLNGWGTKKGLRVVFRNSQASQFFFRALNNQGLNAFKNHLSRKNGPPLITATDGENLGHHNPRMLKTWFKLINQKNIITSTVSNLLKKQTKIKQVIPRASSWADSRLSLKRQNPYILWYNKNNPIHLEQWQLTELAVKIALRKKGAAKEKILRLIYSDQYWWASAQPWWDGQTVNNAAKDLKLFIKNNGRDKEFKLAEQITEQITNLVKRKNLSMQYKKTSSKIMFGGKTI